MPWLKISTTTEFWRFATDDIVFVRADGNYSDVYLSNGRQHQLTFQLHYFVESLGRIDGGHFERVGRSLIINKNYLSLINLPRQLLRLDSPTMREAYDVKVSKEALKAFKSNMEKEGGNP